MSAVTSVYRNVQGLRTAIKDVGRLRQIAVILTRHGFGALVTRMQLTEVIGLRNLMDYRDENQEVFSLARRLRMVVEELGPTFVKLGQILSTRPDLLGPEVVAELQSLQDSVPPMGWEDVRSQIEAALGRSVEEAFQSVEQTALASASIAQVHRAVLLDGQEVVIKIQRANIREPIASDLNIMHFLAARAEQLIPELRLIDPVGIVQEFERALGKELDFNNERNNIERFAANFAGFEGIRVPQVYPKYCTKTLLTMEFVRGVKVTVAAAQGDFDPYPLARRMLKGLFKMVFQDGLFHGDLHPGNILITHDQEIVLIDFGLVGRLLPRQREMILDLLVGISKEDYELVARVLFDIGVKVPGAHYDFPAFEQDVIEVMDAHLTAKTLENIEVQGFFKDLVNGAIKHQIQMPPTYTLVFKALMTVEGIGKTISPELNFIEEVKPFVKDMLLERYHPERLMREGVETLTTVSRSLRSFSQSAPRLLRDLEFGRLTLRVESERVDQVLDELRRSTNRLIRALIFGASAVAGTLALETQGMQVLGLPLVSFGAYVIAGVAGWPLIFSLLSRR